MFFSERERQRRQGYSKYTFILLKSMSDNLHTHSHRDEANANLVGENIVLKYTQK